MLAFGMVVALAHLSLNPQPSPVHGDAEWIMRDFAIAWCCGPQECAVVPEGEVVVDAIDSILV